MTPSLKSAAAVVPDSVDDVNLNTATNTTALTPSQQAPVFNLASMLSIVSSLPEIESDKGCGSCDDCGGCALGKVGRVIDKLSAEEKAHLRSINANRKINISLVQAS